MEAKKSNISKSRIMRIIYITIGGISLAFGCIGIALPVLPSVPFFLLTSYLFSKGNRRFGEWFHATKIYKKYAAGFSEHRAMSLSGQLSLLLLVSGILAVTCLLVNKPAVSIIFPIIEAAKYSYFFFRVKTVSRAELSEIKSRGILKEETV